MTITNFSRISPKTCILFYTPPHPPPKKKKKKTHKTLYGKRKRSIFSHLKNPVRSLLISLPDIKWRLLFKNTYAAEERQPIRHYMAKEKEAFSQLF
jgi:hypothetical protein